MNTIGPLTSIGSSIAPRTSQTPGAADGSFAATLQTTMETAPGLRFSGHAARRMSDRKIELSDTELRRLENATDEAAAKGAREALMMMDGRSFIVSVRDRMVVTAMTRDEAANAVYTNIDTAVIVAAQDGST